MVWRCLVGLVPRIPTYRTEFRRPINSILDIGQSLPSLG